jgi:pentapeptide MXKDX repeat protein
VTIDAARVLHTTRRSIMNHRIIAATAAALLSLTLSIGAAQARTSMDATKKPDAMKTDTMKADPMKTDAMKQDAMKGTKADCAHKAGMETDSMKKADMMKGCDAM